ncbi:MAG: N-acetyl-gamma-glutamyl-phosphate reductase, partial [Armatimonadota bacterium]
MIRAGIIGASGYGGGELVRILAAHPQVELTYLSSETYKGRDIGDA